MSIRRSRYANGMAIFFRSFYKLAEIFILKYPLFFIAFFFPRKSNRWVFGSLFGFQDNTKYFFLELLNNQKYIDIYYLFYSKKEYLRYKDSFPCLYYRSVKGVWCILTSKVFIGTHGLGFGLPRVMIGSAFYIELWHGIGLKKMGYLDSFSGFKEFDDKFKKTLHKIVFKFSSQYIKRDLFLSTSETVTNLYSKTFLLDKNKFIEGDYPRCKPFLYSKKELDKVLVYESTEVLKLINSLENYKKTYIYMPTWRDHDPNYINSSGIDFNKLNVFMINKASLFIIKLHPNTPHESIADLSNYSNIILLPNKMDIYTVLPKIDVLITDYSSIYIDFMHKQSGNTIFFPYDYDEYISKSRELAFNYDENITGIRVDTFEDLLVSIETESYKNFEQKKIQILFEKFWGEAKDKKDLVDAIKKTLQ